ncbi:MAG: MTH1187 family thiamine-binding protein [Candidatus Thorarchaeota archaeon]
MKSKIIAELSTFPVGVGTSLSKYVKQAVKQIDGFPDIRVIHHPMGTVIEADSLDQVLSVTRSAHEAIIDAGADRVVTHLRIDDRRDKPRQMEDKIAAIED